MFETALLIDKYYTPLLCLFGALGNSLSLAVFCMDAKYGSQSSSFYLSALAVSDTGFLLNVFVVWLEGFYGGVITSGWISCALVMYLGQVTCFISIYLTVAFSIERFVAVHYPFSRPRICTRSKAKKIIAGITIGALVLFAYVWIIAQVVAFPEEESLPLDDEVEDMGQSKNVTNNVFPDMNFMTELAFPRHSGTLPQSPFFKSQKSQAHRKDQRLLESMWSEPEYDLEYPRNVAHFTGDSGSTEILRFTLPSTSERNFNFTDDDDEQLPQNLSIDHQNNEVIDSSGGVRHFCTVPAAYHNISEIANYIDSVLTLVLPFFLIAFFNVRIAMTVWKLKDQRRNIVATATTNGAAAVPSSPELSGYYHQDHNPHHRRQFTFRCNKTNSMDDDDDSSVLYRNPSRSIRSICCLLNLTNVDTGLQNDRRSSSSGSNGSRYKRGSTSVRFRDCIEMSEMESTIQIQGPSTLVVSHNLIPSAGKASTTSTAANCSTSPRFCIVRRKKSTTSSEVRVTKTLLLVSLVFLFLSLPAHIIRCGQFIQVLTGTQEGQELLYALQPFANILFNTNFAVNFLLYCVSGRNFRNSLKNVVLRKCQSQSAKMTPRFSWASDRSNKKFKNCSVRGPATASTVVPNIATLADDVNDENDAIFGSNMNGCPRNKKCTPSTSSSLQKCQQSLLAGAYFKAKHRNEVDDDDESEEKEETTTMILAYCNHESFLNYCDEDQEDDGDENQEVDEIASV